MYAIVKIAGKQFRVEEKSRLRVPLLEAESGKKVEFDNVLAFNDAKGKLTIGAPKVDKVTVSATVIEHSREKKVIVFKKKRRKGYRVKNGHRQDYSLILVDKIGAGQAAKPKAEEKPKAEAKPKAKSETVKTETAKPKAAPKAKAEAKPKTADKPKTTTKPKTAEKPKAEKKEA
jgi:large subunit ribosomal protein L21